MNTTVISCPDCTQKLRIPTDRGQLECTCPKCKASLFWHSLGSQKSTDISCKSVETQRTGRDLQATTPDSGNPRDIYAKINAALNDLIDSLKVQSNDETFNLAQRSAYESLTDCRQKLQEKLSELEGNAQWDIFTIAFFGETGAGKSTLVETLRILLQEPTKLAGQEKFRDALKRHRLSKEENYSNRQIAGNEYETSVSDLKSQLLAALKQLEQANGRGYNTHSLKQHLDKIASAGKIINTFLPTPAEVAEGNKSNHTPQSNRDEDCNAALLAELHNYADGKIIGDGRLDFTRDTTRYDLSINGEPFVLLDVPGIEGDEELICHEIKRAVQTAHAVFYVTNQAAPPQTGDGEHKGTLEKIKGHLGSQTEVWTIFNKKIISAKHGLTDRSLTSHDEDSSLAVLDEKMQEQLGSHYRGAFSLSALPAFLAAADCFVPDSQHAKRRTKTLLDFSPKELLEKSKMNAFLELLSDQLLPRSKAKIKRANFNKVKNALDQATTAIDDAKINLTKLAGDLNKNRTAAQMQLQSSFSAVKGKLELRADNLIDQFSRSVRTDLYAYIDKDVSNDSFKATLHSRIGMHRERLFAQLPNTLAAELQIFQAEVEEIMKRHNEKIYELAGTQVGDAMFGFDGGSPLQFNIDNGINVAGIIGGLIGIAMAPFTGGASLWLVGLSAVSLVVGIGKAVWSYFSTDFKKSQQRKSTDDNLRRLTDQLRSTLRDNLKKSQPAMQQKIGQLNQAIEAPFKQAEALSRQLETSSKQMKLLSSQISIEGNTQ